MRVGDVDTVQLTGLTPNTAYAITLYALHGEAASDPQEGTGVTCTYSALSRLYCTVEILRLPSGDPQEPLKDPPCEPLLYITL